MTKMSEITKESNDQYNITFYILSALAIIMVAAGHIGCNIMTIGDLFPYYSFHVPLFVFISGYFYKEAEEEHPLAYIKKKIRRLLIPYFIWNVVYGLIAAALRLFGFNLGGGFSLYNLLVEPFVSGYQFLYNYAAWFVPALFLIEIGNLIMRLILRKMHLYYEGLMFTGSLLIGMAVVWLAIGGHVWGLYKMPGRLLFLYPCFQMGCFYRRKLEVHDKLGNLPYFAIVLGLQLILNLCCNGLAFSSVWCTSFANGPVIPYVTIATGTAFWLRVAKILTPLARRDGAVSYMGRHTYTVMMHHVMIFMVIKMILAGFAAYTPYLIDFDWVQFYGSIDYIYLVKGAETFKLVYLAAGVAVPLLLRYGCTYVTNKFEERFRFITERRGINALKNIN